MQHIDLVEIQHNVAVVRKKLGQYDIAAGLLRQVLAKTEAGKEETYKPNKKNQIEYGFVLLLKKI